MGYTKSLRCRSSGFTLVELLIVIAIIGILATIVLLAIGPARDKAQDAAIKSDLNQIRVGAEIFGDTKGTFVGFDADEKYSSLFTDITTRGGAVAKTFTATKYAVMAMFKSADSWMCVDSTGNAKTYSAVPSFTEGTTTACP